MIYKYIDELFNEYKSFVKFNMFILLNTDLPNE